MTGPSYSLVERLAQHLARPVPAAERARARRHLVDWLGCVAGARDTPAGAVARAAGPDVLERAALLGSVLEMDDVHRAALLHPGPVVWPAALSAARDEGAGMDALLDAGVRGYEAMIAVGATFDAHHYSLFHPTSTAGGFGAAAAAASLYGLDVERTGWALGNAGSVAGGLWHMRHDDVMTKQLHVARAALEGLWISRLARAGLTGPARVLEGPQGVHQAMTVAARPLDLPDGWHLGEVSFKPFAACRHVHPAIDCALALRRRGELVPPYRLDTYADALAFCDRPSPRTELEAKFSLQHGIALVAAGLDAEPQDFTPEAIAAVAGRDQVTVVEDREFTGRYPAHFGARLTTPAGSVTLIDTLGDPERPASDDRLEAKLRSLVTWGGLGDVEADRALAADTPAAVLALLGEWL